MVTAAVVFRTPHPRCKQHRDRKRCLRNILQLFLSRHPQHTVAGNGRGITCSRSSPAILNNTIVSNGGPHGGGVYCSSSSPLVSNNIIAYNFSGLVIDDSGGTPTLQNNCVYNPDGDNYPDLVLGTGNITSDPKLVSSRYGNVHLTAASPCVNAGLDSVVQAGWPDIDGQARIQGAHVDIGSDEFDGTAPTFTPTIIRVAPSGNDANNGSTWALAKLSVQAGINAAAAAGGGDVWVASGTYSERIRLKQWVYVYGGFAGNETSRDQRNWATRACVLDGSAGGSVVTASWLGYRTSELNGFTVRHGSATSGGGICCYYTSPVLYNNFITLNSGDLWRRNLLL